MLEYTMRIALCDDEQEVLSHMEQAVRNAAEQEGLRCELTLYQEAEKLLEDVRAGQHFHAMLLDVMMNGLSGMELAAALRKLGEQSAIVFVSSNREMAVYGYEVSAARFLTKPVDLNKLREALRVCYEAGMGGQGITLPCLRGMRRLAVDDILYAETWGRELRLMLKDGSETAAMKISELEAMLPKSQFTMCHRTVLVNLAWVKYLRYCELELKTGVVLPVSKYRQNDVRERLFRYLES